jgi:hypothetical protein
MSHPKNPNHIHLILIPYQKMLRRQRMQILQLLIPVRHPIDGPSRQFLLRVQFRFFNQLFILLDDGGGGGVGVGFEFHPHHLRKHLQLAFAFLG